MTKYFALSLILFIITFVYIQHVVSDETSDVKNSVVDVNNVVENSEEKETRNEEEENFLQSDSETKDTGGFWGIVSGAMKDKTQDSNSVEDDDVSDSDDEVETSVSLSVRKTKLNDDKSVPGENEKRTIFTFPKVKNTVPRARMVFPQQRNKFPNERNKKDFRRNSFIESRAHDSFQNFREDPFLDSQFSFERPPFRPPPPPGPGFQFGIGDRPVRRPVQQPVPPVPGFDFLPVREPVPPGFFLNQEPNFQNPNMFNPNQPQFSQFSRREMNPCRTPFGDIGGCKSSVTCAVYYLGFSDFNKINEGFCTLQNGRRGLCCPSVVQTRAKGVPIILDQQKEKSDIIHPTSTELEEALLAADAKLLGTTSFERVLLKSGLSFTSNSLGWTTSRLVLQFGETLAHSHTALKLLYATHEIKEKYHLTPLDVELALHTSISDTLLPECQKSMKCNTSALYRSINGTCNNLEKPFLGTPYTALDRILPPNYADGIWELSKKSITGNVLPNPRTVRTTVLTSLNKPFDGISSFNVHWGQFVGHDITLVPNFQFSNSRGIECCSSTGKHLPQTMRHAMCMPIDIPKNDDLRQEFGQECLTLTRAVVGNKEKCTLGYADQMNTVTHWLDLSTVYGSSDEVTTQLRTLSRGLLASHVTNGDEYPQIDPNHEQCFNTTRFCFKTGEIRSNQQPGLSLLHTSFLRFHNQIARKLSTLNPNWNDEKVFQETRRITIAVYQHITYNEYMALVLGYRFMQGHGVLPLTHGHNFDYDETESPVLLNEFSVAAYRMGHTMIFGAVSLLGENGNTERVFLLRDIFNEAGIFRSKGIFDKLLRGYLTQEARFFDRHFDVEVTNHLFQANEKFGMDLPTMNILRGRDHGVLGYNFYREMCNLTRARDFQDFLDVMTMEDIQKLRSLYRSVDDVDLYVGGSLEKPFPDSILGQTFWCIVGYQFQKLKLADRFFYDLGGQPHSFTPAQLREIRKMSLARVLCGVSQVQSIQPMVFRVPGKGNPLVPCRDTELIPDMSLFPWIEARSIPKDKSFTASLKELKQFLQL